jgi:hypothetical protein
MGEDMQIYLSSSLAESNLLFLSFYFFFIFYFFIYFIYLSFIVIYLGFASSVHLLAKKIEYWKIDFLGPMY